MTIWVGLQGFVRAARDQNRHNDAGRAGSGGRGYSRFWKHVAPARDRPQNASDLQNLFLLPPQI